MGLRDIGSTLPPGFRFYPSDEELVCHYLFNKVVSDEGGLELEWTMVEVNLHAREPWELPDVAKLSANEWYFFSFRDRKYATGSRTNRATKSGYWKATGKDRTVHHPGMRAMVGMRKTLVFYSGRAPNGVKTGWVMHEFRLETPHSPPKEDWVLCRVFHRRKGESRERSQEDDLLISATPEVCRAQQEMGPSLCCTLPHQLDGIHSSGPFFDYCFPREKESTSCGAGEEEFGFLWDVGPEQGELY